MDEMDSEDFKALCLEWNKASIPKLGNPDYTKLLNKSDKSDNAKKKKNKEIHE